MTGTGLKKCRPMKRSGERTQPERAVIEMDEVLLAIRTSVATSSSTWRRMRCLSSSCSVAASITRSAPTRAA
ncbi:hypothetical protein D9M69_577310 [compost metagenome]